MDDKFKITRSVVEPIHTETGFLEFADGTRAYWEVDGPWTIVYPDGIKTEEYTSHRKHWNKENLSEYAAWISEQEEHGEIPGEPETQQATKLEVLEIQVALTEAITLEHGESMAQIAGRTPGKETNAEFWLNRMQDISSRVRELMQVGALGQEHIERVLENCYQQTLMDWRISEREV